jgi:cytochrome c oxidase subunit 2
VQLEDGRTVIADENYVRESILSPSAKVVKGFKPIMPVFQGLVSEEQLAALVAYIKSLSQPTSGSSPKTASMTTGESKE